MSESLLSIKDLRVVYRGDHAPVYAVNGISFDLAQGRTVGLVGETGAGKTTTALSIMGLLPKKIGFIEGGSIEFDGQNLSELSKKAYQRIRGNDISMIFQDPMTSLNPVLQVGDQIAEALLLHGKATKKDVDEKVGQLMELVGIPAARRVEYPHQFSGGMKQRIVIAIALACEPKLLIADEPTTALDVTIQAQVLEIIDSLRREMNMSMLLITHDLGVVVECCDDVVIVYAGEVVEQGTVEDIYGEGEHHPYTVGLFDSIPRLDVKSERLHPIDGLMPDPTDLPEGCCFAPRCSKCQEICRQQKPVPHVRGSHQIKCHFTPGYEPLETPEGGEDIE